MSQTPPKPQSPVRKPRLKLPFDNKKQDIGSWTYDNRIGLCVTLIAYLLLMIVFVASKIVVGERASSQGIYIDLQMLAELEQEKERLEREVRERQQNQPLDWSAVQNRVSNEHALDERLKDDRGTNTAALNKAAEESAERMRANREAYEQGLAEERAIREQAEDNAGKEGQQQDRKVKGKVMVSFSLTNPVRTSRYMHLPAYLCESGGDVEVAITVGRDGKVIDAKINYGGDECMQQTAINAARRSRFNIDNSAPARQQGTITYIFIPQ